MQQGSKLLGSSRHSILAATVLVLLLGALVKGTLAASGPTQKEGCQKKRNITKDDVIPGLRRYMLEQIKIAAESTKFLSMSQAGSEEQLEENKLISRIEDKLEPYHPTPAPHAKSVKTYKAHYSTKSKTSRALSTGMVARSEIYKFKFQVERSAERISSIQLLLYHYHNQTTQEREAEQHGLHAPHTAEVSYKMSIRGQAIAVPLATAHIDTARSGYSVIDITADKAHWLNMLKGRTITLIVKVFTEGTKEMLEGERKSGYSFITATSDSLKLPRLVVMREPFAKEQSLPSQRRKRQSDSSDNEESTNAEFETCPDTPNNCCRKDLIINMKTDLQLASYQVIEPETLNVGQCSGSCRGDKEPQNQAHYEILGRTDINSLGPCCVPDVTRGISVVIKFNETFTLDVIFANMQIISCKCV
uniref:Transforming growth factor beta C HduTGFbC n=1 Tax=Halisarca dujardinii TaxID=2583056 RepID=A0A8F8AQK7_HALDU|nr:transforming growth factor beta C HduTGFbC [Halisarca dujardinii]